MKELAGGAPDGPQCDFNGVPQNLVEAGGHSSILVQIEGMSDSVDSGRARLRARSMKCFAIGHHGQDGVHALLPGFEFLGGLQAVGDGVEVYFVQGFEEGIGFPVFAQRGQKIFGNCGFAWGNRRRQPSGRLLSRQLFERDPRASCAWLELAARRVAY